MRAATRTEDGRIAIDKPLRPLLQHIANPLHLGEMGHDATHFVLGQHWKTYFTKKATEIGNTLTVSQLRQWIDEPKPMGLPREVENLVILLFAEQTNRTFFLHGAPYDATLTNLQDLLELHQQKLPNPAHWDVAIRHAGNIFGVASSPLLKMGNVISLATGIQQKVTASRVACQAYCQRLKDRLAKLGITAAETDRMKTASATLILLERLHEVKPDEVVSLLATAEIATSDSAMGTCLSQAAALGAILAGTNWEIFEAIGNLSDERQSAAKEIRGSVEQALQNDEHVVQLGAALQTAQSKAVRLLTKTSKSPGPPPQPPEPTPIPKQGKRIVGQGIKENLEMSAATELLSSLGQGLRGGQTLRVNLSWIIEEGGTKR